MTEDSSSTKNLKKRPENPPTLTPPDAADGEKQKASRTIPLLIAGCGLLLVIAALLVLFLPLQQEGPVIVRHVEPQANLPTAPQPPQNQITPDADFTREIERLMGVWLQKQAEAEAVDITAWGGDRYTEATALARECDLLLDEQNYPAAKGSCEGAIEHLDALMTSREALLEEAIATGLLALEQGKPEVAAEHFQRALAINSDDKRASDGAHRAEQLPAVLNFLQDGLTLEKASDPAGALLAFTAAAALDPDFAPVQKALARVRAGVAEREFQRAMSRALQAMAEDKPSVAYSALQKAESIQPGDPAVHDLRQQLARAQLAGRLTSLRQKAEHLEQEERWPEELNICKEALTLDSHAAFAVSCAERASIRVDLDNRLKAIFAKPERLFEDGPLQAARQALAHASSMTPRGSLLTSQITQLGQLITQAETEVEVMIQSDGLTEVIIYHVGRLGMFQEKTLVLRAGDYTATGSRNGFRDVRQTLKVRPGPGKLAFTLRCEEPI
jgi:tetratricopeptide (TPR) repeat protein